MSLVGEGLIPEVMFGAGVLMLILLLFRRGQRRKKRSRKQTPQHQVRDMRQRFDANESRTDRPLKDAPPQLHRWQVELFEVARELKAEIDTKIGLLDAASRLAAEQAERLERAIEKAHQLGLSADRSPLDKIDYLTEQLIKGEATLEQETPPK